MILIYLWLAATVNVVKLIMNTKKVAAVFVSITNNMYIMYWGWGLTHLFTFLCTLIHPKT
jgi:hypothetical protein